MENTNLPQSTDWLMVATIAQQRDTIAALCERCKALEDLAESRADDATTLRLMLAQAMTHLHDVEQAHASRTERVILLLDHVPHVRQSVTQGFLEECERLRDELLEAA